MHLSHPNDHRPGGDTWLEAGGHRHPAKLHRDRVEKRAEMLVPRGRHQRPRTRSVEPTGECPGEMTPFSTSDGEKVPKADEVATDGHR